MSRFAKRKLVGTVIVGLTLLVLLNFKSFDFFRKIIFSISRPFSQGLSFTNEHTSDFFSLIFNLKKTYTENALLQEQVRDLQIQVAKNQDQLTNVQVLREELKLRDGSQDIKPIACNVINLDLESEVLTAVLDCGRKNGVTEGSIAISGGYVAGKVVSAGDTTSTVLLAVSSQFSIDARMAESGAEVVVQGSYNSGLTVDYIPKNIEVKKRDFVVAAGLVNPNYKGLLIGSISQGIGNPGDLFQKYSVVSPVKFKSIDHLLVLP